jgi:RecB family endonuclease NucS
LLKEGQFLQNELVGVSACRAGEGEMPEEVRLWRVEAADALHELRRSRLDLEARLETWLDENISILSPDLLVIGRQVKTVGGILDLLCLDQNGDLVVVELKRDKTPRKITAQVLDYGSWVQDLSIEEIRAIIQTSW